MWPWFLLAAPALIYLLFVAILYFAQTHLLFPSHAVAPAEPMPAHARKLQIEASGHKLHGVHLPPIEGSAGGPLILLFAGNAWNAESAALYVQELFPAADIVAFHYRGYHPSEGLAGAAALQQDALEVHDWATQAFARGPIVAVGFSIGSGVAAHLAAHRPIEGAILVTPFDSLAEVAADQYPWLPVRFLFRHQMDPGDELRSSEVPVAVLIAGDDRLIHPERGHALGQVAGNVVFQRTIAGASHNDIYDRSEFRAAMHTALSALIAG